MKIKVINPNSSPVVTERVVAAAREAARPGTEIVGYRVASAPSAIESHCEMLLAGPGVIQAVKEGEAEGCHGYVFACFGDPGLNAARELTRRPVVGMAEAAFHAASYVATGFVIITTLARMRIFAERLVEAAGATSRCRAIDVIDAGIGDLAGEQGHLAQRLAEACKASLERHGAEAVVLGSAGMVGLAPHLSRALGVPVIDGVAAAVKWVEGLADLGLETAKIGSLAPPRSGSGAEG